MLIKRIQAFAFFTCAGLVVDNPAHPVFNKGAVDNALAVMAPGIIFDSFGPALEFLFGGRAGFVSKKWFPYFANYRRDGYDFDALYEDGKAGYREKLLMDLFVPSGVDMWDVKVSSLEASGCAASLYTHEMKDKGGFGKGGEKNFEGVLTKLQMQSYLIVKDFKPRLNKRGEEYGWAVAIMTPPEYLWGYKFVTGRYKETPEESFRAIEKQIGKYFDLDGKSLKKIL